MNPAESPTDWRQVLEQAIGASGRHPAAWIFYEDREDLRVEAFGEGPCVPIWTGQRGVRARRGGRQQAVFMADPTPDQVAELLEIAPTGKRGSAERPASARSFEIDAIFAQIDDLRSRVARVASGSQRMALAVQWVGFRQRIWTARPDADVGRDDRSGARIRLVLQQPTGTGLAQAVGEIVLRGERAPADRLDRLAEQVVERLRRRLLARPVRPGATPVVFAPGVAGILIHELVGHALEGDTVERGASALSAARGSVAPDDVTVVDDPRRGRGAWRIDDEGVLVRPVLLLERGRVAGPLHDRASSSRHGTRSTGHGRRSSFRERALPRMGCTFLKPGSLAAEEVIDSTARGVYVRRMDAASTDTRSGTATFKVADADEIEQGRITRAIEPFLLMVNTHETLASLDLIADDLTFDTCLGSCVRDGQPLVTSVGAPTCRIGVTRAMV